MFEHNICLNTSGDTDVGSSLLLSEQNYPTATGFEHLVHNVA
jgi:hypothetical protein